MNNIVCDCQPLSDEDSMILPMGLPDSPPAPATSSTNTPPENLYELITTPATLAAINWRAVLERIGTHPHETENWCIERDDGGDVALSRLPLHAALLNAAPLVVVEAMTMVYPHGLTCRDEMNRLPVHVALENVNTCKGVAELLIEAYPVCLDVEGPEGYKNIVEYEENNYGDGTKLDMLELMRKKEWEKVMKIFEEYENENKAKVWIVRKKSDGSIRWRILPIHLAIILKAPNKVISAILRAYVLCSRLKDDEGCLPLHLALKSHSSGDVIETILRCYPTAMQFKDPHLNTFPIVDADTKSTALFDAILRGDWTAAEERCAANPVEARVQIVKFTTDKTSTNNNNDPTNSSNLSVQWRTLPLHVAISSGAPSQTIRALLSAHPRSAACRNSDGATPLHVATSDTFPNDKVIAALLKAYPCGWSERDRSGRIPLVDYDTEVSELYRLIQSRREWGTVVQRARMFPAECDLWVIRREKLIHPKGGRSSKNTSDDNNIGSVRWRLTALHAALIFHAPVPVIETILSVCPRVAQCRDDKGMTPLHLAFKVGHNYKAADSKAIVDAILKTYPDGLYVKDLNGKTPLEYAKKVMGMWYKTRGVLREKESEPANNFGCCVDWGREDMMCDMEEENDVLARQDIPEEDDRDGVEIVIRDSFDNNTNGFNSFRNVDFIFNHPSDDVDSNGFLQPTMDALKFTKKRNIMRERSINIEAQIEAKDTPFYEDVILRTQYLDNPAATPDASLEDIIDDEDASEQEDQGTNNEEIIESDQENSLLAAIADSISSQFNTTTTTTNEEEQNTRKESRALYSFTEATLNVDTTTTTEEEAVQDDVDSPTKTTSDVITESESNVLNTGSEDKTEELVTIDETASHKSVTINDVQHSSLDINNENGNDDEEEQVDSITSSPSLPKKSPQKSKSFGGFKRFLSLRKKKTSSSASVSSNIPSSLAPVNTKSTKFSSRMKQRFSRFSSTRQYSHRSSLGNGHDDDDDDATSQSGSSGSGTQESGSQYGSSSAAESSDTFARHRRRATGSRVTSYDSVNDAELSNVANDIYESLLLQSAPTDPLDNTTKQRGDDGATSPLGKVTEDYTEDDLAITSARGEESVTSSDPATAGTNTADKSSSSKAEEALVDLIADLMMKGDVNAEPTNSQGGGRMTSDSSGAKYGQHQRSKSYTPYGNQGMRNTHAAQSMSAIQGMRTTGGSGANTAGSQKSIKDVESMIDILSDLMADEKKMGGGNGGVTTDINSGAVAVM